ncbi:metallophosphoesterase family protein [Candidatus Dependentiae bacterium]
MFRKKINYIKIFLISMFLIPQLDAYKFIAMGDPHAGDGRKPFYCDFMLEKKIEYPEIDMILFPGDLTSYNRIISSTSGTWGEEQVVITNHSQWRILYDSWISPLEAVGIESFLAMGNHDGYNYMENNYNIPEAIRVVDMLKYHYFDFDHVFTESDYAYAFKKVNTYFICCGMQPDNQILTWLESYLRDVVKTSPAIIFLHYAVCGKKGNKWWRYDFYNTIKDYNIRGILHGHFQSFTWLWNDNIPIFSCGGMFFTIVDCDLSTGVIDLEKTKFYGTYTGEGTDFVEKGFFDPDLYGQFENAPY